MFEISFAKLAILISRIIGVDSEPLSTYMRVIRIYYTTVYAASFPNGVYTTDKLHPEADDVLRMLTIARKVIDGQWHIDISPKVPKLMVEATEANLLALI